MTKEAKSEQNCVTRHITLSQETDTFLRNRAINVS